MDRRPLTTRSNSRASTPSCSCSRTVGEARLFTGSANATAAAFGLNVEVLVELFGKKKDCGIASLLGSEDHPRLETLRSLLQEYTPPSDPIPDDGSQEGPREEGRAVGSHPWGRCA